MLKRINKIVALVLIGTSIGTITPIDIFTQKASALDIAQSNLNSIDDSESDMAMNNQINQVTMASSTQEQQLINAAILAAQNAGNSGQLYAMNSIIALNISGGTQQVTLSSSPIGTLSYKLTDAKAKEIKDLIVSKINSAEGQKLTQTLMQLITNPSYAAYRNDAIIVLGVMAQLEITVAKAEAGDAVAEAQLIAEIKTLASLVPMYQYTGVNTSGISSQGFTAGGLIGLMTTPSETYNASVRNATYNVSDIVPSLTLSSGGTFKNNINLGDSKNKVICDGLNISVLDSNNKELYCINNPVYTMFKVSGGGTASKDLNVISFPTEVVSFTGGNTKVALTSEGIEETSILSLSLSVTTASAVSVKSYDYATTIDENEKKMIDSMIDGLNIATSISSFIKSQIKSDTFVMIPNLNSSINGLADKINNTISSVTNGLNNLSDSMNDLTDSLNDKNDDVNDAWDKVFDRFDNSEGWGTRDGYRYYYDKDGVSLKGVQKIKGKTYYFNRVDGAMETGWQIVDGKKCCFDKKKGYELFNQWVQDNGDRYFLGEDGAVKKMEWINTAGKMYYVKADGKMTKDWLKIDDYWYFFNADGSLATSTWKWKDDNWYYLKNNGQAATGWIQLDDKWYYFKDPTGVWQTGWFRADGNWYCTNEDGSMKTGWANSSDGWCYLDDVSGKMKKNEWVTVNDQKYYFNINGIMVTGSRYISGTKYVFNSDGSLS